MVDFVDQGNQVFISIEFLETLEKYKTALMSKGITVSEISGRNVPERERERIDFQKGLSKVVLCTVTAGISLHSGETLPDGSIATKAPRITLIHDLRQNALETLQALGRAHRDGQNSLSYIPYLEGTVDAKVIDSFINKQANLKGMTGSNDDDINELEGLFREAAARTTPPNKRS